MKTNLQIIAIVAILVSACTTGTQMTRTYDDDIYFSPGDVPPVTMISEEAPAKASNSDARNQGIVMSQREKNADGTVTQNNYIYKPEDANKKSSYQAYDMDQQDLAESDTSVYYNDDSVKYVINNYYEDNSNDLDFSYRINRFHRPYFYDPFFYDDWNYGLYSGYYPGYSGWGYDSWFMGGWGYPYGYYGGYYSPLAIGFGFGGYWGGGYGGYYNPYYGGYYDGFYGGYYGSGGYSSNYEVARRRPMDLNMPNGNSRTDNNQGGSRLSGMKDGSIGNSSDQRLPTGTNSNTWVQNGHTRGRAIDQAGTTGDTKNATIVNNRRGSTNSQNQVQSGTNTRSQVARPGTSTSGNIRRVYEPSTTGRTYDQGRVVRQSQNYTPSYNKPRIVNQSNYNNNSYTRPRTSDAGYVRGAVRSSSSEQGYSAPRSSSNMRQTYNSSSSYSNGSSNSSGRSSEPRYSSSPSNSNSSPSYSAPERSSSSGGGGSYSGGSSSGSSGGSSSGSSGGGHRR
ncbi:MAG TPA: hypothetical protein VGK10_13960 [Prolixibacteraceae bacterium]|jgi:hypothetical protein